MEGEPKEALKLAKTADKKFSSLFRIPGTSLSTAGAKEVHR